PHRDLNPDLALRRHSFYPVELWGEGRILAASPAAVSPASGIAQMFGPLLVLLFLKMAFFPLEFGNQTIQITLRHGRYGDKRKTTQGVVLLIVHHMAGLQTAVHGVFFVEADA